MVAIAGNYLVPETISYNHKVTMKTTMTSIEWFAIQLCEKMYMEGSGKLMGELINQAKEMHKHEIIDARENGIKTGYGDYLDAEWGRDTEMKTSEEYYNETFKNQQK